MQAEKCPTTYHWENIFYCVLLSVREENKKFEKVFVWLILNLFSCCHLAGRRTVLVHHQTGIAAITVTTLSYQVSHLAAANVPSPVSEYSGSTTNPWKFFCFLLKNRSSYQLNVLFSMFTLCSMSDCCQEIMKEVLSVKIIFVLSQSAGYTPFVD